MIRVLLFDRFDSPIGELAEGEVFALSRVEEVNGEHSLTITTTRVLEQGWRVLTRDARDRWREHVVYGTDALHASGDRPVGDYYCVWSLQADLMGTRVSRMPGVQTPVSASVALGYAIEGTARWQAGTVTNTNTGGGSMYDMDGWSAMSVLIANWGGEVDATIEVGSDRVAARKVDLYARQGDQEPKRRYDFGADILSIRRKVEDGPLYCRITPRGMGEETEGGYGRRITIESVNDGKDWLENASMVDLAKLPDGHGGWEYPTLEAENSDCETPAELKAWGLSVLDEMTQPKVTYEIDVLQLAREGVDLHGVSLGDAIHAVDRRFGAGVRVSARVMRVEANLLDEDDVRITVGSIGADLAGLFGRIGSQIASVTKTVMAMNGGTMSTAEYLSRLIDRLNSEINATGGYTYVTEGHGILTYDAAVTDPLVGAEASKVVEIKGGSIRIADSKTAQGAWEWKTVFTSGHVNADLVTAAKLEAGYIGSQSGNYWNLDTGELAMVANKASIGGKGIATVDEAVAEVDVEYRLSESPTEITGSGPGYSWSTVAPEWVDGAYMWQRTKTVNAAGTASYSSPTCIAGATGASGSGVTVSSVRYAEGSSGTSAPTSGWQTTVPAVAKGKWLWVKTEYSDGSVTTSCAYQGTDGEDGDSVVVQSATKVGRRTTVVLACTDGTTQTLVIDDGEDGDDGTPGAAGYVHTAWANSADGTADFSTSVSAGKKYLGVYSDNSSADSQRPADYAWSLIKGADGQDGQDGQDGVGVSQVVEQYYLSTSSTTQTGGSWSTDQPAWVQGKYIWTRSAVTWTTGSTSYTDPVLAKAINGANQAVATLDGSLDQQGVFNRLTNNGQAQGIYMSQGEVYVNASYINAGVLSVASGQQTLFEADIDNGTIFMSADAIQIGSRTLTQVVEDGDTVYGTLATKTVSGITRLYASCPQFEPNDGTVMRLRVLDDTATYDSDTSLSIYINGAALTTNYGSSAIIPAGTTLTSGYMAVLEGEHFSASAPARWRWRVTGCEAPAASERLATRELFARDSTSVEVNAGRITFNANSFVVNSTYFQVTSTGVLTATSGTIGGLTLASDHIYNDSLDLTGTGLKFLLEGDTVAKLYPQYLVDDPDAANPTLYGILGLQVPYSFQILSKLPEASGDPTLVMQYEKTSDADGKGRLTIGCKVSLDRPPAISSGVLTTTVVVPRRADDGFYAVEYVNGMLTDMTTYEGTAFYNGTVTIGGKQMVFSHGRLMSVSNS